MVLWETAAYLTDDARRARAFDVLRERVGTSQEEILAARFEQLMEATRTGGDLGTVPAMPPPKAKKGLMRFPMIGEPGAEKILSFAGRLRVLVGEERKGYAATPAGL